MQNYYRKAWKVFQKYIAADTKSQMISLLLAAAILFCQIKLGIIHRPDVHGSILAIAWPYLLLASALFIWHWIKVPPALDKVHEDTEQALRQSLSEEQEKNAKPDFGGYFLRPINSALSDSNKVSFNEIAQVMKMIQPNDPMTADFDVLIEVFIENRSLGLAQIIHFELSMIVGDEVTVLENVADINKYRLANIATRAEGFMGRIEVVNSRQEHLVDLKPLLMGTAPIGYRNKVEGWLLFKNKNVNPDVLREMNARYELTLYDSNGDEHKITKLLQVPRTGVVNHNPNHPSNA